VIPRLKSSPLKVGSKAPDFTLPDGNGDDVRLYDLLKNGPAVIFFYPKAFSNVCTAEACAFRDSHDVFAEAGAGVVGISTDSVETQKSFAKRYNLPFPVVSDKGRKVHGLYGVRNGPGFVFNDRVTFVIDRDGIIRHSFTGLMLAGTHVKESLEIVQSLLAGDKSAA
jgi:peroxiredoxin Q/BCP